MGAEILSEIEMVREERRIVLRGDGTIFLPEFKALLVADLHLGKTASFQAAGIAVPAGLDQATLELLSTSIAATHAEQVFLLGDLIHDRHSLTQSLIAAFADWRKIHAELQLVLVRGNHDRWAQQFPETWKLCDCQVASLGPFELVHEAPSSADPASWQFGGHWHPVVAVGRGADKLRLPCFVVSERHVTLPAFGPFKGGMNQDRRSTNVFYPIAEGLIWRA